MIEYFIYWIKQQVYQWH